MNAKLVEALRHYSFYYTVPIIVAVYTLLWRLLNKLSVFHIDGLLWVFFNLTIACVLAVVLYPKKGKRTYVRMISVGCLIPLFLIFIIGCMYGVINPGWLGGDDSGNLMGMAVSSGILIVPSLSLMTYFTPYLIRIMISLMFVER